MTDTPHVSHVIDTSEGIAYARLLAIKGRLDLEIKGIRFKGRPILAIINGSYDQNFRTKKKALEWVEQQIQEKTPSHP